RVLAAPREPAARSPSLPACRRCVARRAAVALEESGELVCVLARETHVERGDRRLEMLDASWTDDHGGHRRLGEQPGNRQRCRADPALGSRCGETFQADEGLLAEEVLVRPRPRAEPRPRRWRLAAAVLAAQQTARERPERRVADVELLAEREYFVLVAPLEK